jgi:hypothetical protein
MTDLLAERVFVTPEMAKAWLANPATNRLTTPSRVEAFALVMLEGFWNMEVPKPILFNVEGLITNGYHRLKGIVRAAEKDPSFKGIWLYVKRNCSQEIIELMDQGRSQTLTDTYQIRGDSPAVARQKRELASPIFRVENRNEALSVTVCDAILKNLGEEPIQWMMELVGNSRKMPAPLRAALVFAYPINPEKVREFGHILNEALTKAGATNGTALSLIRALKRPPDAEVKKQHSSAYPFKMSLRAIQAHLKDEPYLMRLRHDSDGHPWAKNARKAAGHPERMTPKAYSPSGSWGTKKSG